MIDMPISLRVESRDVGSAVAAQPLRLAAGVEWTQRLRLAERERVRLDSGLVERDLEDPFAYRVVFANELVQTTMLEQAVPVLVDVYAVRLSWRLAVDRHPERNRFVVAGRQYEVSVACLVPVGDAPAGLVEHDALRSDRPLAVEGPVVETQIACTV